MPKGNATTQTYEFYLDAEGSLASRFLGLRPTSKLTRAEDALTLILRGEHVFVRATDAAIVVQQWENRDAEDASP